MVLRATLTEEVREKNQTVQEQQLRLASVDERLAGVQRELEQVRNPASPK